MRTVLLTLASALLAVGCDSRKSSNEQPAPATRKTSSAPLTDLTATSGLGTVRTAFNAHKGEARFLTLLSPT